MEKEVEAELFAIKHWLKVMFLLVARDQPEQVALAITEMVAGIKNHDPDQFPQFQPGEFDRLQLDRIPSIERVGGEIAEYLRSNARLSRKGDGQS